MRHDNPPVRLLAVCWLSLLPLLAGCHHRDGARHDDGFRSRLAHGCRSEPDCLVLELEAQARVDRCPSFCEQAEADLRASSALVARYRRHREARQAQIEAQRQAGEAAEAERRRAELEAAGEARAPGPAEAPAPARPSGAGRSGRPRPAPDEGRVCCCDGTLSPTCTYVKRGCCSHHGGVCACP